MKFLLLLSLITFSTQSWSESSCPLIDQIHQSANYLKAKEGYIREHYDDRSFLRKYYSIMIQGTMGTAGLASLYKAHSLTSGTNKVLKSFLNKPTAPGVLSDDFILALKNSTAANKRALKFNKTGAILISAAAVYYILDNILVTNKIINDPTMVLELNAVKERRELCNKVKRNSDLKRTLTEFGLKLYIASQKVEKLLAENQTAKLDDSGRKEVKEVVDIAKKNIKANRVNK